ncbi:MAG: hypothetical protein JSS86_02335 [Cyanobacteria bacterium SZAS LIN-2]|nr:hypothetical protein [Cyanobacteria bacterium SZAS LIN-3]MBS1995113.1 hypothetical protein [Cyanobacteria bacterium SZAS LIN-2]
MPKTKKAKQDAPADAPQVVLEHTSLSGDRLRVVIMHAPGIDYFVVVERFENDEWKPVKRSLKEIWSPVTSIMDIAVLQLTLRLKRAEEELAKLQP